METKSSCYRVRKKANVYKPSAKKNYHHDSNLYWPASIKYTIQWFPFLTIIEYTTNIINPNKGLFPSLLKVFPMFELSFIDDIDKFEAISIMCINCKKETGLYLRTPTL